MNIRTSTLLSITMASFLVPFMLSAVNIALPTIALEFKLDTVMLSWIQTSYLLTTAVFLIPCGKIADIFGRRKIINIGLFIYTISSLLVYISNNFPTLIILRILQGIGGSMIATTAIAILTSVFPLSERGKVLGINSAAVYTGIALGPFLGGILTELFNWRSIFLFNSIIGIVSLLFLINIKEEWKGKIERFDFIGSFIYSIALIFIVYGLLSIDITALFGLLALFIFIIWELKIENPIIDPRLFVRNRGFSFSSFSALINYSATYATSFLLSLYLQMIKGFSPKSAGMILLIQPLFQAILSPLAGRLSDKIEPRKIASIGMAMNAIGLFLFSTINLYTEWYFIFNTLILMGIGFAFFASPNTNAIMSSVKSDLFGIASAIISTMRVIGQNLSFAIATFILSLFKSSEISYSVSIEGISTAFLVFSITCIFGTIFSILGVGRK
jgi:EmrB/QacA subfamily drug resistance transporter